jgi:hypothetical protein
LEEPAYLTNNASRMRYHEHRQASLPITTTLIESTIKQINRRMKGTEKFWQPGADPQLQLCADRISETNPLATFWSKRAACQTGFCKSRATNLQTATQFTNSSSSKRLDFRVQKTTLNAGSGRTFQRHASA